LLAEKKAISIPEKKPKSKMEINMAISDNQSIVY
jgi:hypothetical protein